MTNKRLPDPPAKRRALKTARQNRWRHRVRTKKAVIEHIDYSVGVGAEPVKPMPPIARKDLAELITQRGIELVELGLLDLTNKDHVAGISAALKAQSILDAREKVKAKTGQTLELYAALRAILDGAVAPAKQLDDGLTIAGEFEVMDGET